MSDDVDEEANKRRDAYRNAQAHVRPPRVKRFYRAVAVSEGEGGFTVTLDDNPTRTPGKALVVVPSRALAEAMAAEWQAQTEWVDAATMPLTRLINSAVDGGQASAPRLRAEVVNYAANDLLLYRAEAPEELVAAHEKHWDPVLVALARHFGISFQPTVGIRHQPQPQATLERLTESLSREDHLALTAMSSIANLTGSGLLAIALRQGLIGPDPTWAATYVDEDHNIRLWGADAEAMALRTARRREFDAAVATLAWVERPEATRSN